MNIWKGAFSPFTKHRLYTGDYRNHIDLITWDVEGNFLRATAGFFDGTGNTYDYEIEIGWDEAQEMDEDRAKEIIYLETHGKK